MASDHDIGAIECAVMLAGLHRQALAFRAELTTVWKPGSVHGAVEFGNYPDGPVVEIWTELTINPAHDHVAWWLDIMPGDAAWRVEAYAYFRHHQTGKQTFFMKEQYSFASFDAARDTLPEIMLTLLATKPAVEEFLQENDRSNQ